MHPCNASPDREDDQLGYLGNTRLLDLGCNLVRGKNSIEGDQRHVMRMRASYLAGRCNTDWQRMPLRSVFQRVEPTIMERVKIWARAEVEHAEELKRCATAQARGKDKQCLMSVQNIYDLIVAHWAGNGRVFDVTGAAFNMSIDRTSLEGHYEPNNCRPMHKGLNSLKSDANDRQSSGFSGWPLPEVWSHRVTPQGRNLSESRGHQRLGRRWDTRLPDRKGELREVGRQSACNLLTKASPHRPALVSARKPSSTSSRDRTAGSMVASVAKAAVHKPTLLDAIRDAGPLAPIPLRLNYSTAQLAYLLVSLLMPAHTLNAQVLYDRLKAPKLSRMTLMVLISSTTTGEAQVLKRLARLSCASDERGTGKSLRRA